MVKEICQYIVECHEDNVPIPRDLSYSQDFAERLNWHSTQTRQGFENLVNRDIRVRKLLNRMQMDWLDNVWKEWLEGRELPANWVWDPYGDVSGT
jgi:hypothetical protein